jgi:hypothetical protein
MLYSTSSFGTEYKCFCFYTQVLLTITGINLFKK